MARRKKELNTTKRNCKISSSNEGNMHMHPLNEERMNIDDDGGSSSLDESGYEDPGMLKPEEVTNIVIGDLKTVCVTKAASDDESDTPVVRGSPNTPSEHINKVFSSNQSIPTLMPTPNSIPPPCEHPKKKIVRLMNAAQYFNQDIVATINPISMGEKVESEGTSPTILTAGIIKCNGELPTKEVVRSNSINSEYVCDATSSPIHSNKSPHLHRSEKHCIEIEGTTSNRPKMEASSRQSKGNSGITSVGEERESYHDIDEILRKTAPFLQNLTSNLQEVKFSSSGSRPPTSSSPSQNLIEPMSTDVSTSETTLPPTHNQIKKLLDDFSLSMASGADTATLNTPLSAKLASCTITCDPESMTRTDKECSEMNINKSETLDSKSMPENKSTTSITTFDFLSCERSGKRFTKPDSVDQCTVISHKFSIPNKSIDQKLNVEHTNKIKNDSIHEKPKTDIKPKKNDGKMKKGPKKELNSKHAAKIADVKINKAEKEKSETKETKEKRRRSTRLKSKPEYSEKYEDVNQLLMPSIVTNTDKDTNISDTNSTVKKDDGTLTKQSGRNGELISATIAIEPTEMPSFQHIMENEYHTERSFSKDAERMICDCVLTREDIMRGERGCGEDCLNRLLLIECCSRCTLGDRCTNKRFHKREYAKCEVFRTSKKGNGLKVLQDIPSGTFIMEYVGEVIDSDEFERRALEYAHKKIPHFYFMSLKADCIIDATIKGNCSRFINHSCEPNAETQKWTVQGELRIGFFSKRDINAGEEITFDYQLQRYGKQAQRCYCETPSCTGWIGEDPDKQQDNDKLTKEDKKKKKPRDQFVDLETALDEISQVGLINRHQTLSLNRLMVHAKELPVRMQILQLIEEGHPACRRLFVDYHGLPIIWSWMVDCTSENDELKLQLLKTLMALPITNKTILIDSKVYALVEQWAFAVDQKIQSEALSAQSVLESVEDIATADETPVSEMAQKVLNIWSSLREAYRIPRKERIQQMKEHEREADQNVVKPRPRRLPMYAEKMRDRYHRNRHNRDKEFDKLYFDSWKRRDSPDSRDHHRKADKFDSSSSARISKMERRYMFEMKVAREKEEKEMIKRQKEEQENYWLQQSSMYYAGQQHQLMAGSYSSTGQYIATVPPTPYSSDPVSQAVASQLMQSISSISSAAAAAASNTHPYYPAATSSYMPQGIMLPHMAPTQSSASHSQPSSASVMIPQQVSSSPTAQSYYQNASIYQNSAASSTSSYAHQTTVELATKTEKNAASVYTSYDYQMIPSPSDTETSIAASTGYSAYNDSSLYADANNSVAESIPTTYATNDSKAMALANASTAAIDITKIKLPPKWKAARDSQGCVYYYHTKTRVSQWYPPVLEEQENVEEVEQYDVVETSEDESSAEEDEDDESVAMRKRRHQSYDEYETITKRRILGDTDQNFDMDAELKENLAAMSCEFQDSDNDEYSPQTTRDIDQRTSDALKEDPQNDDSPPPSTKPLITEHIISPREPIDKEERMRNKKRIKSLKEKLRLEKRLRKKLSVVDDGTTISGIAGAGGVIGGGSNSGVNSISSSDSLLSVPADTSSITDRKRRDVFRSNMANFVVHCLNPYFRSSCTTARITNYNDFKHLARKLTHFVMLKELKHCRSATELTCNSSVKHKAKEYIRKYMSKFGEIYVRPPDDNINY